GLVDNAPGWGGGFRRASFRFAGVAAGRLRIDFAGHSTFLITSPRGVKVATDYNDYYRARVLPDIATMSGPHQNHATWTIEPEITHALYGWDRSGSGVWPRHDVTVKDLRVYSVPVNLTNRSIFYYFPSSVFVVESNGLCVAHLGLLGHVLDREFAARIGRIDVLMTPIDRRVTQSMEEIVRNIRILDPRLVIPMHYNAEITVEDFLQKVSAFYTVRRTGGTSFIAEKHKMPAKTEVLYLKPPVFTPGF
ncbi:MAG: MBL fold metallo-hydrolase, partial [Rhodospirillales bacterium]|nr:MBL fold metallo-hydrolase [Rhodospirillales bacterium]